MKTHTTTTLRTLIIEKMHPENRMSNQETETWIGSLPEMRDELTKHMSFFVYGTFAKSLVERQLQQIQTECTFLLNAIDKHDHCTGDILLLKNITIDCLGATLDKIITQYPSYADLSKNINKIHFRQKIEKMKMPIIEMGKLMKTKKITADLQIVLLEGFQKIIKYKTASYENVNYLTNLLPDLIEILSGGHREEIECSLNLYLFDHNYNSELFIQFKIKEYHVWMVSIENLTDRQSALLRLQSELQMYKTRAKSPRYLRDGNSIYHRLIHFVETELNCTAISIERARPMSVPIIAPVPVPYKPIDYKLRFNLSVDCLAYLIKVMVNANIIDPGIKAELQRYVAENFQTPGTKSIGMSAGSFQTKYKNVTQSTSVTVKAALMAMLKLIDKEF